MIPLILVTNSGHIINKIPPRNPIAIHPSASVPSFRACSTTSLPPSISARFSHRLDPADPPLRLGVSSDTHQVVLCQVPTPLPTPSGTEQRNAASTPTHRSPVFSNLHCAAAHAPWPKIFRSPNFDEGMHAFTSRCWSTPSKIRGRAETIGDTCTY